LKGGGLPLPLMFIDIYEVLYCSIGEQKKYKPFLSKFKGKLSANKLKLNFKTSYII
tara:strand:+ start:692 stop:859 length:168 start_codon:yes stop_codon:yes gene_type:complete